MKTYKGTKFFPRNPNIRDVNIDDIAHGLAGINRWNGQLGTEFEPIFYSVAEHSVHVSYCCDKEDALIGLLHDSPEAYIGDLIRPIKYIPQIKEIYKPIEKKCSKCIAEALGLETIEKTPSVQMADDILLISEAKAYRSGSDPGFLEEILEKYPGNKIIELKDPWSPKEAKKNFLERFHELTNNKYKS